MKFDSPFAPGAVMHGSIVPTTVDAEVATVQKPYEGKPVEIVIEQMEPERLFSFRWHPYALESGFGRIPLERRVKAFTANHCCPAIR